MLIERTTGLPAVWDEEADVVVVGSGGAALTGAATAAIEGASVLVLEKAPKVGGTTAKSGGGVWIADNHHMPEVGVEDSREDALGYLRAICHDPEFDEMLETIVDRGKEMVAYLEAAGVLTFESYPGVGGTLDYRPWIPGARYGGRPLSPGNFDVSLLGEAASMVDVSSLLTKNINKLDFYRKRLFQTTNQHTY